MRSMSPVAVSYIANECYGIIGVDGLLRVTGMGPDYKEEK